MLLGHMSFAVTVGAFGLTGSRAVSDDLAEIADIRKTNIVIQLANTPVSLITQAPRPVRLFAAAIKSPSSFNPCSIKQLRNL